MPDLDSFIVSAKNQEEVKSSIKRKKKKKGSEEHDAGDDDDFFDMIAVAKPTQGTRSRPPEVEEEQKISKKATKEYTSIKVAYPHKKHQTRQAFLDNWPENFSKYWDVCCHWSFKNKHRMYGSVQFESVIRSGPDREGRQSFF